MKALNPITLMKIKKFLQHYIPMPLVNTLERFGANDKPYVQFKYLKQGIAIYVRINSNEVSEHVRYNVDTDFCNTRTYNKTVSSLKEINFTEIIDKTIYKVLDQYDLKLNRNDYINE